MSPPARASVELSRERISMRLLFWVWLSLFAAIGSSSSQQAPIRMALVMGNAAYPSASARLPRAIADTRGC